MTNVIIIIIILALAVLFAVQNMHHVVLNILFAGPVQERLIFLLLGSFILGVLTAWSLNLLVRMRKRSPRKRTPPIRSR